MGEVKNSKYLDLALYAFGGLGLELIIMTIEVMIYGTSNWREWGLMRTLLHWTITCIVWGSMAYWIYRIGKKNGYDLLQRGEKPKASAWLIVCVCLGICVAMSYISWDGAFKVIAEFESKMKTYGDYGWVAYIFQYVYYLFETVLVLFVVAYGQKFGEGVFQKRVKWAHKVPWGGILCGITWGLIHILSKGSLSTGLALAFCSMLYGVSYLLLKKDARYAYPLITLMFIL
ncbi:MAG: hypothetical protein ACRCTE_02280 [Cellulosilyticaceae bacterium]